MPDTYEQGTVTVVTVNWNSLTFLRPMVRITRAMSPSETRVLVVDNGSSDGSREWLRTQLDLGVIGLPLNVGHGYALDIAVPSVHTEYIAVLDVDAFPVSPVWIETCIDKLQKGAHLVGARMHRNYIHPSFFVARTEMIHRYGLTFRPAGSLYRLEERAPFFMDVGERLAQRVIVRYGGSSALCGYEVTESLRDDLRGAVFGDLVYHNLSSTWGPKQADALSLWREAVGKYQPEFLDLVS